MNMVKSSPWQLALEALRVLKEIRNELQIIRERQDKEHGG